MFILCCFDIGGFVLIVVFATGGFMFVMLGLIRFATV